jgi:hypothetical protein
MGHPLTHARLAVAATLALCVAVVASPTLAQKNERAQINEQEYVNLIDDLISVLPNTFAVRGTNPNGSTY